MDTYVYGIIILILIELMLCLVRGVISERKMKKGSFDNVLILHKSILNAGLLCFFVMAAATVAVIINKESAILVLLYSLFSYLGLLIIVAWSNCRIFYNGEMFTVKYLSGKIKNYSYNDVTDLTGTGGVRGDIKIYAGKKVAVVDSWHEGNNKFVNIVRRRYKELHDGKILQITSRKKVVF